MSASKSATASPNDPKTSATAATARRSGGAGGPSLGAASAFPGGLFAVLVPSLMERLAERAEPRLLGPDLGGGPRHLHEDRVVAAGEDHPEEGRVVRRRRRAHAREPARGLDEDRLG